MKLTPIEERIVAAMPANALDQDVSKMCTVGHCMQVKRAWGTCMCLLIMALQNERKAKESKT